MTTRKKEPVLPLLNCILTSKDVEQGTANAAAAIEALGFGGFVFGLVWGSSTVTAGAATLLGGNLEKLVPIYLERDLIAVDPVTRSLRSARRPILWDFEQEPEGNGIEATGKRRVKALMAEFGISAGVTIPVDIPAIGCRAALSVSAQTGMPTAQFDQLYADNGHTLHHIALALAAALSTELVPPHEVRLSCNERAVLEAMADGLRPREIARLLGKSEHTIRNQITSAQNRLGARTKEQALVTAARLGLIKL